MSQRACLVLAYGSSNVLAAMASVRWHGERSGRGEADRVVVVVHPPAAASEMVCTNGAVVERLVSSQGWPDTIVLADDDVAAILRSRRGRASGYRQVLQRFRERVGEHFDEVHYAHDLVGRVPELAMNAFPRAAHIVYGDTLGSIYDREYFMALASGATIAEARRLLTERPQPHPARASVRALRALRDRALGRPRAFKADAALLILPMDQTGTALGDTPVWVVPRRIVLEIIEDCRRVLPMLAEYTASVLESTPEPHYLLLLENYSDAGMASCGDEVAMYESVIRANVPEGATVLLKMHPLATGPVDVELHRRLAPAYVVETIPKHLGRFPMELWGDLVARCEVISMLSYCGISLAFLYDKQTIYPITAEVVERFFPQRSWDRVKDADTMYRGQLANLADWDGSSLLWRGDIA